MTQQGPFHNDRVRAGPGTARRRRTRGITPARSILGCCLGHHVLEKSPMRLLLTLMLAVLSLPLLVQAQVRETSDYLRRMDANGDGRVSLAEYQAWMGYAFERMDRNGDRVLGADELPGGRGKPVSVAAHRESLAAAFRRQDTNRDGMLDARELAAPPPR